MSEATIDNRAAPKAPARADTLPPPGAGLLSDIEEIKFRALKSISFIALSATAYSIILSLALKVDTSLSPKL